MGKNPSNIVNDKYGGQVTTHTRQNLALFNITYYVSIFHFQQSYTHEVEDSSIRDILKTVDNEQEHKDSQERSLIDDPSRKIRK